MTLEFGVFLSQFFHLSGHIVDEGRSQFLVVALGLWCLHRALVQNGFLSTVSELQSWLCLLVAVDWGWYTDNQSDNSLLCHVSRLHQRVFQYLGQFAVSEGNVTTLLITKRWDALAKSWQALIDRAELFHLDLLVDVRIAVFLTASKVNYTQLTRVMAWVSIVRWMDHLDLEDCMTSWRDYILVSRWNLAILKSFLKPDVRLLTCVNHDFLEIVDDEVAILLLSHVKAFSVSMATATLFATTRIWILRRESWHFEQVINLVIVNFVETQNVLLIVKIDWWVIWRYE